MLLDLRGLSEVLLKMLLRKAFVVHLDLRRLEVQAKSEALIETHHDASQTLIRFRDALVSERLVIAKSKWPIKHTGVVLVAGKLGTFLSSVFYLTLQLSKLVLTWVYGSITTGFTKLKIIGPDKESRASNLYDNCGNFEEFLDTVTPVEHCILK
jgi:hypothetical protein